MTGVKGGIASWQRGGANIKDSSNSRNESRIDDEQIRTFFPEGQSQISLFVPLWNDMKRVRAERTNFDLVGQHADTLFLDTANI